MKQRSRTVARTEAFKLVFQMLMNNDEVELALEQLQQETEFSHQLPYVKQVAYGVCEHKEEIDNLISSKLKKGWRLSRLSKVSLAILEMAVYEIFYVEDVPGGVAINEAVDLVKLYDEPEQASFVNGILAGILKDKG